MDELVKVENQQVVTTSRNVADHFEKQHKDVLKAIDNLVAQNCATKNMFLEQTREYRGQEFRYFLMNRDGFTLLVMGFNGAKALEWKLKYIEAFNKMEKALKAGSEKIQSKQIDDESKRMRAEAMLNNSKSKQAKIMLEIAQMSHIDSYKEVMMAKAGNLLAGENVLPMPKSGRERKPLGWFCKSLGKPETWASQLGKVLKQNGISQQDGVTGEFIESVSPHNSKKQIQPFEWYVDYLEPELKKLFKEA